MQKALVNQAVFLPGKYVIAEVQVVTVVVNKFEWKRDIASVPRCISGRKS
jgi:hypothetical protein